MEICLGVLYEAKGVFCVCGFEVHGVVLAGL
jgi:hypothetical protein